MILDLHPKLADRTIRVDAQPVPPSVRLRFKWDFHRAETRVCEDHHARISIVLMPEELRASCETDAPADHDIYIGKCLGCGGVMFRSFQNLRKMKP